MGSGGAKVGRWMFWVIFSVVVLTCLLVNCVGLVVGILEIMEEEEGVDEKDGDEIIIGVGSDVAGIKLRYVESMFFNGDCGGVVRFDDVIRVGRVRTV